MKIPKIEKLSTKMLMVGTVMLASVGYLGGHCVKLFCASTIPVAHGFVFGAFPLMTCGAYLLAQKVSRHSPLFNPFIAMTAGYLASYALSNILGLSISLAGPLVSFTAFATSVGLVTIIAGPAIIFVGSALGLPFLGAYIASKRESIEF